ncbi:MAG: hypothetical protein LBF16_05335, partial [Pseudomonadales bacterium]|nr:hypothetical protein [Pseudomonadales bacterium]
AAPDTEANTDATKPSAAVKIEAVSGKVIPLVAGERLTIPAAAPQATASSIAAPSIARDQLAPDEVEVKLAWRVGMLVFQGEPLETVLQEIGRYTTVKLEADAAIRDIRIEGLFRAGDIDGLLISMEKNFNVSSQRTGADQILFTARTQEE